jgi:hypothetical protein
MNIIFPQSPFLDAVGRPAREWTQWLQNPSVQTLTVGTFTVDNVVLNIPLEVKYGGTGLPTIPTDGQLLIGNGTGYTLNTLTAGTGLTIANSAGAITTSITDTGVVAGSYGSASSVTTLTVNAQGQLTVAGNVAIAIAASQITSGTLPVVRGGTGANNAAGARLNLEAAKFAANSDITSLSGLTGGVSTPTFVQFNTTPTVTPAKGKINWNSVEETLNIGMDYGVVQQVGQETYARVENLTGSTLLNGTVVGFAGVGANNTLSVAPYLADGTTPSLYILGVMTHALPNSGEIGYCTTFGHVGGLDTSAFSVGDILYASPTVAGAFTNVKPTAPDNVIPVAAVLDVDATDGEIFVRPTITQMQYYGVFTKTTDQSPALVNTEYLLTFDNTQISNGVIIGVTTSQIIVPQSGLYKFDATLQLTSGNSSAKNIWVWFKKNGTAIANSARIVTSDLNNGYIPITLSESVSLAANEYVELAFAADSTSVTVDNVAATAFAPAAPSIILNVTQVQQ